MRWPWRVTLLRLLVLAALVSSCVLPASAVNPGCPIDPWNLQRGWYPTPDPMPVVGRWFGNTEYNATICAWTFSQHELSWHNWKVDDACALHSTLHAVMHTLTLSRPVRCCL
jgi:hypothetical protein